MKKITIIIFAVCTVSGCVSGSPPICYNKANITNHVYDIAVFKKENSRYMAGYPFYTWTDESQFVDTSECDKL
ncbi:uncharacterized protein (DUF779 family) [Erwinia persicina]|uniref:phage exclusion lipoprotein Cor n=1 Tax=Erwinia persicina TaxID=55211 RepID=UPI00209C964E|nr:hypothetical protein [Erwinia persicina]MCP1436590.1 uncharacterized protein (DUF779 family) [Erwinia persicina]